MMRGLLVTACMLIAWSTTAHGAIRARDLVLLDAEPFGPRGGVLMVKVASTGPTTGWPSTVPVRLSDHGDERDLEATLAWLEPAEAPRPRPWSWDGANMAVRPVAGDDDTAGVPRTDMVSGVYMLLELPLDASGVLMVGGRTYTPRWLYLPKTLPNFSVGTAPRPSERLRARNAPNRPLADSPFTWWRWVLLADRLGAAPPAPPDANASERLVAEHIAQLWRIGFHRLAEQSRGVAARCRDLLTETCRDDDVEFATWIARPSSVLELLGIFMNTESVQVLVDSALAWADRHIPEVVWVEQSYGATVQLAIANPDPRPRLVEMLWSGRESVPLGDELTPNGVTRITLDRPQEQLVSSLYPELIDGDVTSLNLVIRKNLLTLPFGPGTLPVEPPGALLGPFRAPMTLNEVRSQLPDPVPVTRSTYAQLRRMNGRWELFLECFRPNPPSRNTPVTDLIRSLEELKGTEAVSILIGRSTNPRRPAKHIICIPELQPPVVLVGPRDEAPEAHRQSYADRWLVRFVIPNHWLPDEGNALELAMIRTHGDDMGFETSPNACVPWRMEPDMVRVNLDEWEQGGPQLKRAPRSQPSQGAP